MRQVIGMQFITLVLFMITFLGLRYVGVPWAYAAIFGIMFPYLIAFMAGELIAESYTDAALFNISMLTVFLTCPVIGFFDVPTKIHWCTWPLMTASLLVIGTFVLLVRWIKFTIKEEMRYGLTIFALAGEILIVTSVLVRDLHGNPLWTTTLAALGGIIAFLLMLRLAPPPTITEGDFHGSENSYNGEGSERT